MAHIHLIEELLRKIRVFTNAIIGVKVSPDQPNHDLQQIAEIVSGFNNVYINAGNTTYRKCIDINLPKSAISIGGGGMSGSLLFERTREMIILLNLSEFH